MSLLPAPWLSVARMLGRGGLRLPLNEKHSQDFEKVSTPLRNPSRKAVLSHTLSPYRKARQLRGLRGLNEPRSPRGLKKLRGLPRFLPQALSPSQGPGRALVVPLLTSACLPPPVPG